MVMSNKNLTILPKNKLVMLRRELYTSTKWNNLNRKHHSKSLVIVLRISGKRNKISLKWRQNTRLKVDFVNSWAALAQHLLETIHTLMMVFKIYKIFSSQFWIAIHTIILIFLRTLIKIATQATFRIQSEPFTNLHHRNPT
jgi:hypothetical protein